MKTTLVVTMVALAAGCGGESECSVDMESTVDRLEAEACPDSQSDEVLAAGTVLPTYSAFARLTTTSTWRELSPPVLASSMQSAPAATVCWYEFSSRFPVECSGETRPDGVAVVTRGAYRKFGLPRSGVATACSELDDPFSYLSGRVTTTDDPASVSCGAALPTGQPFVAREGLPSRLECTYRWKRAYACVYDRGLGGVGGLGSPGGP